jgi:S-formylglutathione hydrolase FrmB
MTFVARANSLLLCVAAMAANAAGPAPNFRFEIAVKPGLISSPQDGRLFVIISRTNSPEPRLAITEAGAGAPISLARDVKGLAGGTSAILDHTAFIFPVTNLAALPPGDYFVQALLDSSIDLRLPNGPGNLYSLSRKMRLDVGGADPVQFELDHQIPGEQLPHNTDQIKFVKIRSKLLSEFHHRPIYLRAGIILPRDYERESSRRYPLWVRIGGYGSRYTAVRRLLTDDREFRPIWLAEDTPRFVLLQLDGAGPYGDPYYVNSDNNGPYGDMLVQELIPYIEQQFRVLGQPRARVLSGVSTGGWVSLALQFFYPDFFNGVWSSCPDPVDFRAYELVNIYQDNNAYVNTEGKERPSERDLKGNVVLTMRREVGMENLLGPGNSYTRSGEQWGSWNAVYSPRGADGLPMPLWDRQTGLINHTVAEEWKKYDLRLFLEKNWKNLGPKLRGKIHIASGEADQYFLNNAMHLLDDFLAHADPPFEGQIAYGPGKGHGWLNLSLKAMLREMAAAAGPQKGAP